MELIERFADVYRSRGLSGFARFIATRIAQRREDLLFEMDLRLPPPGTADRLADCVVIDRRNVGRAEVADVERQVFVNENGAYRPGLSGDDLLFAYPDRGRVLCYAFILFHTPYKRVLGRPIEVPMIGNCYTEPDARGRGL